MKGENANSRMEPSDVEKTVGSLNLLCFNRSIGYRGRRARGYSLAMIEMAKEKALQKILPFMKKYALATTRNVLSMSMFP